MMNLSSVRLSKKIFIFIIFLCLVVFSLLKVVINEGKREIDMCLLGTRLVSSVIKLKRELNHIPKDRQQENFAMRAENPNSLPEQVTVYYVWCKRQHFEFRHYLSVKSALEILKPDSVILYHKYPPLVDSNLYNIWLQELHEGFPFLQTVEAPRGACDELESPSLSFVPDFVNARKGIYLGENTILVRSLPNSDRDAFCALRTEPEVLDLFIVKTRLSCERTEDEILNRTSVFDCPLVSTLDNNSDLAAACVVLDKAIFPKDIWHLNNSFGRLARTLFYGKPEIPTAVPSYDELVPKIGHVIWFGGGNMDFMFFLSVLSLLYVAEVDVVYVHGNLPPSGYYWSLIKNNSRLRFMARDDLHMVYGQEIRSFSHKSDVLRAEIIYRYGGIYLDTDAVFVKPLDQALLGYDAVGSYDWIDWNHPFPEIINFGVAVGKKGGEFWRLFQESMRWFKDDDFSWNGLRRPYQVLERHPSLIHIDPHLQVICFYLKCHSTWWRDFHNKKVHHLNQLLDWRNDTYVFHFTFPSPSEFMGYDRLLKSTGMFADIGKHILDRSGFLEYFERKLRGIARP